MCFAGFCLEKKLFWLFRTFLLSQSVNNKNHQKTLFWSLRESFFYFQWNVRTEVPLDLVCSNSAFFQCFVHLHIWIDCDTVSIHHFRYPSYVLIFGMKFGNQKCPRTSFFENNVLFFFRSIFSFHAFFDVEMNDWQKRPFFSRWETCLHCQVIKVQIWTLQKTPCNC